MESKQANWKIKSCLAVKIAKAVRCPGDPLMWMGGIDLRVIMYSASILNFDPVHPSRRVVFIM